MFHKAEFWVGKKVLLSFIGTHILYLNAQRPAVMENMKLMEHKAS